MSALAWPLVVLVLGCLAYWVAVLWLRRPPAAYVTREEWMKLNEATHALTKEHDAALGRLEDQVEKLRARIPAVPGVERAMPLGLRR